MIRWSMKMSLISSLRAPGSFPNNLHTELRHRSSGVQRRTCRLVFTRVPHHEPNLREFSLLHNSFTLCKLPTRFSEDSASLSRIVHAQSSGDSALEEHSFGASNGSVHSGSRSWGLLRVGALIGSATVISKILGLVRETVLAAVFGVGPVVNAYCYASIIPGFFLALLGGINGPFHSAMAATLSKRPREDGRVLIQRVTAVTVVVCGALSLAISYYAAPLLDAFAPGLSISGNSGTVTRDLAILQLKIMSPCTLLAALIGIGFGSLSAVGVYGLPSLSPALSSITIITAVAISSLMIRQWGFLSRPFSGSIALATGTTCGALAQWVLQAVALQRAGFGPSPHLGTARNFFEDEGVREVFSILLPAAVASGLLQIATFTDLYFASFIPGAAAGLGYANLLVMAPLGILSSAILVPMLPMFSRLSKASDRLKLEERVKQGLLLSMILTFLMTALVVSFAEPIVRIVFQRRAFDALASKLVSSLLVCYAVGSTFTLGRDLLVRVFYSLGDSHVPFHTSVAAIFANVLLDWIAVRQIGLGVEGLVLATSLVSCVSAVGLLQLLSSKMEGLRLRYWIRPLALLGFCATIAGISARTVYEKMLPVLVSALQAKSARSLWAADLTSLMLASGVGTALYFVSLVCFRIPETETVLRLLQART
ncbi:hypothetical protein R1flu_012441 [Riccia fluitans]|uniref:Lipid II flippase MurJ n=1 Tax=Riccia fluitans TaxID=41844 RepID=A0ABD1ZD34_9MARC